MASQHDPRLFTDHESLVALHHRGDLLHLPSFLQLHSILSGQRQSPLRGRGLNFEEMRHYQQGDDVRHIDWRVTARTGKPHVRVYNEEKDHHVTLCIDQRNSMFFASVDTMKSVVAAEISAIIGGSILRTSDRVGISIFSDQGIIANKPTRTRSNYLYQLRQLVEVNQSLHINNPSLPENQLTAILNRLLQNRDKNTLIIIVSDFHQCDQECIKKLQYLQRHNHVLCISITDPLEQSFDASDWIITDGELQINMDSRTSQEAMRQHLHETYHRRRASLSRLMQLNHLPLLELDTSGQHIEQLLRGLGG